MEDLLLLSSFMDIKGLDFGLLCYTLFLVLVWFRFPSWEKEERSERTKLSLIYPCFQNQPSNEPLKHMEFMAKFLI